MANPVIKVWLREPRFAWRNDGGAIPRGFRGVLKRKSTPQRLVTVTRISSDVVRKGHWAVRVGNAVYAFSPAEMRRLYSRVPL